MRNYTASVALSVSEVRQTQGVWLLFAFSCRRTTSGVKYMMIRAFFIAFVPMLERAAHIVKHRGHCAIL